MVAALVGLSAPAFAHHSDASGETSCSDGSHTVTWSISNSESDQQMTVVSATAVIGGQSYAVTGYASPVDNGGTTTATSTVPGGTTGTIVLTADVSWPDRYTAKATASVNLLSNCSTTTTQATTTTNCDCATTTTQREVTTTTTHHCECTTTTQPEVTTTTTHHCGCSTTTTVPETTTTEQATTTTAATTTTTEVHELGSTTIFTTTTRPKATTTLADASSSTVATTTPVPGTLPFTGGNTNLPVIFGGLCIAAGAALAFRKRGAWSR
jgi:LPXTG-motif cell wall-anchored protein